MADIHIDIERMIMHSNYLLEVGKSSVSDGLTDMERKQYLDQIKELVQTVQTLLDANIALGNKQEELKAESERKIAGLQEQVDKLTGELQARRRKMHGKNNEKQTGNKSVNKGKTKDEEEEEYIENGCEQPSDSDESDEGTYTEATNPKKDLSQRPDRYLYAWVRDKDGNEFAFFVPKDEEVEQRACTFVNESKYDMPSLVPHTSSTGGMLSDVCCWSHVRRLFVSASRDYKDTLAQAFIDLIGILYKVEVENQVLGRTEKEIVKHRGEESLPVLHDIYQQATALLKQFEKNKIKLSAKLQQALTYMTKHWEELMAYTKIGSVLIDNNCCERAVRPFTNLRKNFGGFSSEQGARVTATYLTFVETCKLMAKAPLDFFKGFFDMIVAGRRDYALMTEALLVKPV